MAGEYQHPNDCDSHNLVNFSSTSCYSTVAADVNQDANQTKLDTP